MKKVTEKLSLLLGVSMLFVLCAVALFPMKASAENKTFMYELGESVEGTTENMGYDAYAFAVDARAHINIKFEIDGRDASDLVLDSFPGDELFRKDAFKRTYDADKKVYTYTTSCMVDPDIIYGFIIYNNSKHTTSYRLLITEQPEITLSQTTITELTNTKHLTMTVKYKSVKHRLGYQIEYATDSKFKEKTRVNTGATSKDIGKLTKGKTYYVRVRSYARYEDGTLTYSRWSPTKKIKIKQ